MLLSTGLFLKNMIQHVGSLFIVNILKVIYNPQVFFHFALLSPSTCYKTLVEVIIIIVRRRWFGIKNEKSKK